MPRTRWQFATVQSLIWPWSQSSGSKVNNNGTRHIFWRWSISSWQIWKACLERQKRYSPNTFSMDARTSLTLRSKVTINGTRHIVYRWSTYMPNMKSLSWTTKKLQPRHNLLWMHGSVWPWGQSTRSKVTNNGTQHIVWWWSTYMPNMQSLSWTTRKLQPGHDLLRKHGRTDRLISIGRPPQSGGALTVFVR